MASRVSADAPRFTRTTPALSEGTWLIASRTGFPRPIDSLLPKNDGDYTGLPKAQTKSRRFTLFSEPGIAGTKQEVKGQQSKVKSWTFSKCRSQARKQRPKSMWSKIFCQKQEEFYDKGTTLFLRLCSEKVALSGQSTSRFCP
jgi:hypothetical protein